MKLYFFKSNNLMEYFLFRVISWLSLSFLNRCHCKAGKLYAAQHCLSLATRLLHSYYCNETWLILSHCHITWNSSTFYCSKIFPSQNDCSRNNMRTWGVEGAEVTMIAVIYTMLRTYIWLLAVFIICFLYQFLYVHPRNTYTYLTKREQSVIHRAISRNRYLQ